MPKGKIVAGVLAPHPPHLVYAEGAAQNEARGECGWEELRWAYARCRESIRALEPEVLLVHTPHWQTIVGHHVLGLPRFQGHAVDPIFPHLFRYHYDLQVDVDLSLRIAEEAAHLGLLTKVMKNPDFRIDYGTITSLHLMRPEWDLPVVVLSANNSPYYFSDVYGMDEMSKLGQASQAAIAKSGKRAVLLASNSLSHRHFTREPEPAEDMTHEHIYDYGHYLWDMKVLRLMAAGQSRELLDILPEYIANTAAEVKAGGLTWMLAALDYPSYPAEIHGYGSVIGTGNAVVAWQHERAGGQA